MEYMINTIRSKEGELVKFKDPARIELSIFNNKYRVSSEEFNDGNYVEITKEEFERLEILKNKKISLKLVNSNGENLNDII